MPKDFLTIRSRRDQGRQASGKLESSNPSINNHDLTVLCRQPLKELHGRSTVLK